MCYHLLIFVLDKKSHSFQLLMPLPLLIATPHTPLTSPHTPLTSPHPPFTSPYFPTLPLTLPSHSPHFPSLLITLPTYSFPLFLFPTFLSPIHSYIFFALSFYLPFTCYLSLLIFLASLFPSLHTHFSSTHTHAHTDTRTHTHTHTHTYTLSNIGININSARQFVKYQIIRNTIVLSLHKKYPANVCLFFLL